MKLARWMSTWALSLLLSTLLLGTAALMQAQDQREDAKQAQPENRPEATTPSQQDEPSPREAKPSKQQNEDKQNEDKPVRREDKPVKQEDAKHKAGGNGQSAEQAHGSAGRRGGHIPDDKFRAHFGRQHTFKVQRPTVVEGQPTFQYGGYSFVLVDVWPAAWAYTDECYIDYIDGEYFLFDVAHPDVRLSIVVVL